MLVFTHFDYRKVQGKKKMLLLIYSRKSKTDRAATLAEKASITYGLRLEDLKC